MTLSIWRYSHLLLAISSSLFLLIASVTGVILALEPIANKIQPYAVSGADDISLAEILDSLNGAYDEVLSISRDRNGFVSATVIADGQNESFYINPFTGERLGKLIEKAPIFQFSTNLHRSLFLKSPGRIFIGLTSLLLFLIAVSGIVLIAKRQGGYSRFFSPVVRENFSQYHHVVYARLGLLPILILAVTGVYLSLLRFDAIPQPQISNEVDFDNLKEEPLKKYSDFELLKRTRLSELRELEYPFSEFVEDYYVIRLKNREVLLNQYTGEVLAEQQYPFVSLVSAWATVLHTGEGSILWSIVLGLGSLTIPFLMITGFVIYFKRPKTKIKNKFSKDNSQYVILVGTEGGTTLQYAQELHIQLLQANKKSYLAMMNDYGRFKNMEHLVIITATYGQGEAPSSATKFAELVHKKHQKRPYDFSVVGFGSTAYPHFCQFAHDTHTLLKGETNAHPLMEVFTINDQSFEAYNNWGNKWSQSLNLAIQLEKPKSLTPRNDPSSFVVVEKYDILQDDTFLLELKKNNGTSPRSGDLLSIAPLDNARERLYSIGKLSNEKLVISVKRHSEGLCSNYLYQLEEGEHFTASVVENKDFHFPSNAKKVVLVATGTGIGPFLGMIDGNLRKTEIHLYWGGRTPDSLTWYKDYIYQALETGKLKKFNPAYSRQQTEKIYVQHLIKNDGLQIAEILRNKGCVMICESVGMQKEVLQELDDICTKYLKKDLSHYQNRKQIKMDCY